jgi:hypothetical protein
MGITIPLYLFIPSLGKDEEATIYSVMDAANRMPICCILGKKQKFIKIR